MVGIARGHQKANTLKPYSQKTSQSNHTRTTALSNSVKLIHAYGATQDGRVIVERSDRMWSTGEGNGKPLQCSCLENPMNSMKRQNDKILKEELPRWVGAQYATGDQWRSNSRKNEGMSQNKNNTQLCMWLVIEARDKAKKVIEAKTAFAASEVKVSKSHILSSCVDLKGGIHCKLYKLDLWLDNVFLSKCK